MKRPAIGPVFSQTDAGRSVPSASVLIGPPLALALLAGDIGLLRCPGFLGPTLLVLRILVLVLLGLALLWRALPVLVLVLAIDLVAHLLLRKGFKTARHGHAQCERGQENGVAIVPDGTARIARAKRLPQASP